MFRREKDIRRTVKAVREHALVMEAFGRAAGHTTPKKKELKGKKK